MQPRSLPHQGSCVLLVDDDDASRTALAAFLQEEGLAVVEARDGLEALAAARRWDPAVIVLDLVMPRMNAWGFAAAYRREMPEAAPIVVLSGVVRDPARIAAETGAVEVLAKPVALEQLVGVVRDLLQRHQQAQEEPPAERRAS